MRHETPDSVACVLLRHLPRAVRSVLDPAVGTGSLLAPLVSRCQPLKRVVCVDTDASALVALRTRFATAFGPALQTVEQDFLHWAENRRDRRDSRFDCVVMNPPFAARRNQWVDWAVPDSDGADRSVRRMPIEAAFTLAAVQMLRQGGDYWRFFRRRSSHHRACTGSDAKSADTVQ